MAYDGRHPPPHRHPLFRRGQTSEPARMVTTTFPERPFTTRQAQSLGISRKRLAAAEEAGMLRRVLRGVYVPGDLDDSVEVRAICASLVVAPGSVVRDRTAAWIHGVDVLTHTEHELLPPVETCVPRFRAPSDRVGVDGGTRDLARDDVMTVHGLLVTTPLRTALDLGCNLR